MVKYFNQVLLVESADVLDLSFH